MQIYSPKQLADVVRALKQGQVVVIPTETSYGMAVDSTNSKAVKRLYKIKGRQFKKPIHVLVSSRTQAKQLIVWNKTLDALTKQFWPGALTLVARLKHPGLKVLTSGTGFLGVRMSPNKVVLDIVQKLQHPITATSANVAGMPDCYSINEVVAQFKKRKNKPDILIDAGTLPRRKPSTVVKVDGDVVEILREGPISKRKIQAIIKHIT